MCVLPNLGSRESWQRAHALCLPRSPEQTLLTVLCQLPIHPRPLLELQPEQLPGHWEDGTMAAMAPPCRWGNAHCCHGDQQPGNQRTGLLADSSRTMTPPE